jgi:hypothetical protein
MSHAHTPAAVPFTSGLRTYRGACSCGAVRWEVEADLAEGTSRCNCTRCSKSGWWGLYVKPAALRQRPAPEQLLHLGPPEAGRAVCRTCGIVPFVHGDLPELGGEFYGLNVRLLEGVALEGVPVRYLDGLHDTWALLNEAPYRDPFVPEAGARAAAG